MFGGFGSNNNNSTQSGGLFGKANTGSTGFSFGNTGNGQNTTTSTGFGSSPGGLFGNSNNNNSNNNNNSASPVSGGLFGNNNTTNTTNTTSGGLFGNSNSVAPASGGLLGNNTNTNNGSGGLFAKRTNTGATGGLFGNNSTNTGSATGGLFGSRPSNTSGSTGGLFSNNNSSAATNGGLFGSSNQQSSGLFGNGASGQSGSLFGSNTLQNNASIGTPPSKQYNVKDLPRSLTDSTKTNKIVQHSSNARKRSLSNSSATSIPPIGRSSILERLGRVSTLRTKDSYDSEGLFTSKNDLIQSAASPEKSQDLHKKVTPRIFSSSSKSFASRTARARNNFSSDYLKLKVDSSRTEARRLKLFGSSGGAQKVRILGREDEPQVIHQIDQEINGNEETFEEEAKDSSQEENNVEEPENAANVEVDDDDYWCSPSIEELSRLQLRQLSEISGFTIGRKGYGSISFELPVDLTAFWSDLPGYLFGNVVKFNKNKTVEVYPNGSVPLGTGLNVPSTITVEKVFPITKSKQHDPNTKDIETRLFVRKLKEQKGMEFVTYDPINGSWTFKVKHFSIWGLVDEDAAVIDIDAEQKDEVMKSVSPEPVPELKAPSVKKASKPRSSVEDTFIYKKQRETRSYENTSVMPGSFIADDSLIIKDQDSYDDDEVIVENILSEADNINKIVLGPEVPSQLAYEADDSLLFEEPNTEDIDEKQFEPEDVDVEDFNILEADPKFAIDEDWDRQLELSSHYDSVFSDNSIIRTTIHEGPFSKEFTPGELDKLLFGDFGKVVKSQNKIKAELRLTNYNFARFTSDDKLLIKDSFSTSTATIQSISPLFGAQNKDLISAIFSKHFKSSKVIERSNTFPKVAPNHQLNFKLITSVFDDLAITEGRGIWELASVLFDGFSNGSVLEHIDSADVSNRILEIKRREGLSQWIKSQIQQDLETQFEEATDIFEQIFLLLVTFEISTAAKLAIKTKNPHLAALISLLGSNDPEVKFGALKQVEYWKKNAVLQTIPKGLLKIYYLLQGNVLTKDPNVDISENLSWKAKLGLLLSYGNLNEPVNSLIDSFITSENIIIDGYDDAYLALLKLYVHKHEGQTGLQNIFGALNSSYKLDTTLQWFVYEILVRSGNQVTFGAGSSQIGDRLTTLFAEQLVSIDLYAESIFVLSHLSNDEEAKSIISKIVNTNIEKFSSDNDLFEKLHNHLKVPVKLLKEAIALHYRFTGESWKEANALLDAGNYDEAHKTIVDKVAPNAVINNGSKLDQLHLLIDRFPEQYSIKNWTTGLAVYKNYIQFIRTNSDAPLRYLIEHVPLVQQSNYKVKLAVRLISKSISLRLLEVSKRESIDYFGLSPEKILKLPLGEDRLFFDKQLRTQCFDKQNSIKDIEVL